MGDLLATLKKMGIEPIGTAELEDSRYTSHRLADPFQVAAVIDGILAGEALGTSSPVIPAFIKQTHGNSKQADTTSAPSNLGTKIIQANLIFASGQVEKTGERRQKTEIQNRQGYTEDAFQQFIKLHGLKFLDNRSKKGALWVFINHEDPIIIGQLKTWGFHQKPGKGWWRAWNQL